jgi:RND family efflux transporter MFP subunit
MKNKLVVFRRLNLKNIVAAILILAAVFWLLFFENRSNNKHDKSNTVPVKVAKVQIKDMPMEIKVVGNVVAKNTVAVRPRVDSQIVEIKFKDGDYVKKNQLLFVLDDRSLKAQLNQAEANLARDKANMVNLKRQYERSQLLVKKGYESFANLDTAKADYEVARANFKATDSNIDNLRIQVGYTKIIAPISGRAGSINITVGNNVRAGDSGALVTINQVKPIRVQINLPEKYLEIVHEKISQGIAVDALHNDGKTTMGKLEYMDNNVDQTTGSFVAKAIFENENEKLWPGMFVTLKINLGDQKNAITVPEVAIQHGQTGEFVFAIVDNKVVKKDVKVARIQNGIAVVEDGLNADDIVAVDGLLFLRNGIAVSYAK